MEKSTFNRVSNNKGRLKPPFFVSKFHPPLVVPGGVMLSFLNEKYGEPGDETTIISQKFCSLILSRRCQEDVFSADT